MNIKSLQ